MSQKQTFSIQAGMMPKIFFRAQSKSLNTKHSARINNNNEGKKLCTTQTAYLHYSSVSQHTSMQHIHYFIWLINTLRTCNLYPTQFYLNITTNTWIFHINLHEKSIKQLLFISAKYTTMNKTYWYYLVFFLFNMPAYYC